MSRFSLAFFILSATMVWGQEGSLTPVTPQEAWQVIAAYLGEQGVAEEQIPRADGVQLPGTILATSERTLRVAAVCWDNQMERASFRLECHRGSACIPFLVLSEITQTTFRKLQSSRETEVSPVCSLRPGPPARKVVRKETVLRVGDHAMVVFRGDQMQLSVQVTCVERGAEGEIIRVRNADGVLFRARVVGPGLLEALSNE